MYVPAEVYRWVGLAAELVAVPSPKSQLRVNVPSESAVPTEPKVNVVMLVLPLEGVTYRALVGKPAISVPLNLACRGDERSAATLGFIDLARRLA